MRVYLAGGVSGNLNPAWRNMSKNEITVGGFIKGLFDENFWQGGSEGTGYMVQCMVLRP